jgi:hypothetical protein
MVKNKILIEKKEINKKSKLNLKKNILAYNLELEIKEIETGKTKTYKTTRQETKKEYIIKPPLSLNFKNIKDRKITDTNFKKLLVKEEPLIIKGWDDKKKIYKNYSLRVKRQILNENNLNLRFGNNILFVDIKGIDRSGLDIEKLLKVPLTNKNFKGTKEELNEYLNKITLDHYNNRGYQHFINQITDMNIEELKLIDNNNFTLKYVYEYIKGNKADGYFIEKKKNYEELKNIYNENIICINNPANKNCLIWFFEDKYKKEKRKQFKLISEKLSEIENKNKKIFYEDFINILEEFEISICIWSIEGEIYNKYSEHWSNKLKYKVIFIYLEDNHIYEIITDDKIKKLTRKRTPINNNEELKLISKIDNWLYYDIKNAYLNEKKKLNLVLSDGKNYFVDDAKFFKLISLFNAYNIDKEYIINKPQNIINKIFKKEINIYSILPYDITGSILQWTNEDINIDNFDNIKIYTFDKNLCYTSSLAKLPFIPYFNILTNKYYEYKNQEINIYYLYFIELKDCDKANEIYLNNGFYFGFYLNKFGFDDNIIIKYVFECDILRDKESNEPINPYKNIIKNLFDTIDINDKEIKNFIKNGINSYIGQMMTPTIKDIKKNDNYKFIVKNDAKEMIKRKIKTEDDINENEIQFFDDEIIIPNNETFITKYNDEIYLTGTKKNLINWNYGTDNKPLNILIKNYANALLIDTINKIKIDKKDILEINTDGITLINADKYNFKEFTEQNDIFNKWKLETVINYKPKIYNYWMNSPEPVITENFLNTNNNNFEFNLQYAGGGKTYTIINLIKENLKKDMNYSYIILASQHNTLKEYRKQNFNTSTIKKLSWNEKTIKEIKEKNIYVDEVGLCDISEIMYLMRHTDKNFYFYGDLEQLKPVGNKQKLNIETLKKLGKVNTEWKNYRNKFTKEQYEQFIKNYKNSKFVKDTLKKYNTPIDKAKIILCYRNETVEQYNNLTLQKLNKNFDENNISDGIPIINNINNNKLYNIDTKEEEIIFNKHSFTVKQKLNDNEYIIYDGFNNFKIDKINLINKNNFSLGYCLNLYSVQGQTLQNFHYVEEDIKYLSQFEGALYTLISRLKE